MHTHEWSLYLIWNFILTFTQVHDHGNKRWPMEVTSNTYVCMYSHAAARIPEECLSPTQPRSNMAVARNLCAGRQAKWTSRVTRGVWRHARPETLKALKCHFRKPFQVLTWSRLSYDSVPKNSQTFKYVFSFLVFFNIWCFLVGDGGGNCPPYPSASYGHVQPLLLRFLALLVQTFTSLSGGSPSSTSAISSDKSPSL